MLPQTTRIVVCKCAYSRIVPEKVTDKALCALKKADVAFDLVDDLCGLAARQDKILQDWSKAGPLRIAACHNRAVRWLFHWASAPLNPEAEIINMRTADADSVIKSLLAAPTTKAKPTEIKFDNPDDWTPWFPVIDYSRCKNCKQCLNFCLFGVYELDEHEKVKVVKPAACKTGCPACARVCPETAIIFPKYSDSPINGDKVDEMAAQTGKSGTKLSDLLSGDVRQVLARRNKTNKTSNVNPDGANSIAELARLKDKLDIPPEVIRQLQENPSSVVKKQKTNNE